MKFFRFKKDGRQVRKIRISEWILGTLLAAMAAAGGTWLFFQRPDYSLFAAVCLLPLLAFRVRRFLLMRFERRFSAQFCSALVYLSGCLTAGMRLERAIGELSESKSREYALLRPEFQRMQRLIQLNWPVEQAFAAFAERYPDRDVRLFSTALSTGAPAGMNLAELVRQITASLRLKKDTRAETEKTLNLPKYNNRIILVLPFLSVFAVRRMAASYAAGFDSPIGKIILACAFAILVLAWVLGDLLGNVRY